ncbi:unnamed protein product [Phytophthora fragariaefolia]|uniref:Unnamed protein product n=1 Tax=Phytophthora fragariaefolia TaxID=1490495 RepID=A0A9W6YD71_9STRA|nr:unnamed protein product [Phytophthora fragariaefolia]
MGRHQDERAESFVGLGSPESRPAALAHLEIAEVNTGAPTSALNICDRRWCGLVLHSVAVGIVSTVLPLCVYPFLTCNLNMEGTQTLSARSLMGLPWALKPIFALFIHCFPLPRGWRLRAIMIFGWSVAASALIAIYSQDQPTPYFQDRKIVGTPVAELSSQQMSTINFDAPAHGAFYVMLMCVASIGYVLADVAADELIRDVATHHFGVSASPHDEDKVFQPVMTKYRVIAILGSFLFMGFGMSGWDYGGDFDFTLEPPVVAAVASGDLVARAQLRIEPRAAVPIRRWRMCRCERHRGEPDRVLLCWCATSERHGRIVRCHYRCAVGSELGGQEGLERGLSCCDRCGYDCCACARLRGHDVHDLGYRTQSMVLDWFTGDGGDSVGAGLHHLDGGVD